MCGVLCKKKDTVTVNYCLLDKFGLGTDVVTP